MKLIVCLDDDNGMLFLGRRQSMDRCVREQILDLAKDGCLWMNAYTAKQFDQLPEFARICEDPLACAGEEDYCFAENLNLRKAFPVIEKLIVFRWNRRYPSNQKFPWDLVPVDFICLDRMDFRGFSHECITREVYAR